MPSIGTRIAELYRNGGVSAVLSGVRRFFHFRMLRLARYTSSKLGRTIRLWSENRRVITPIFVVGSPRSGTSVFARCFRAHPDIAEWSEAGRIWDPNYSDPESDHVFTASDITEEDRSRIRNTFLIYTKMRRKERFLNKHPRNSLRVEYIREIFPDALFVHVVRHPAGPVDSMMRRSKQGDRKNNPYGRFVKPPGWREDIQKDDLTMFSLSWEKVNSHLLERHDDIFHVVRYEDFCDSPVETLNEACEFAGLEPVFGSIDVPEEVENHNPKSVENLGSEGLDCLWSIVGPTAEEFGYTKLPEKADNQV